MDNKKTADAVRELVSDVVAIWKSYRDRPKPVPTLEYIGELVEEFKWIDPMKLDHAMVSSDFLPPDYNETKTIKFPLEKEKRDILKRIPLQKEFDWMMSNAWHTEGYSVNLDEYEKVYNDESRIEHYIDHQVLPAMVSIRMDRTGAYDWLMIQMEQSADNLCQMIYDLKRDGYGTPDRAKEKVFEFFKVFVEVTERVRTKTDKIEEVTKDAEIGFYTQTADFELKYLKAFVLQDDEARKDLYH